MRYFLTQQQMLVANIALKTFLGGADMPVYPEDREAGYSSFSNPPVGNRYSEEAEISPGKPKAELNIIPDKAGFLRIHLISQKSGVAIIGMRVALMSAESPRSPLMTMSCESSQMVLLPPNKRLLLHVTSDGFREWSESVGEQESR